VTNPMILCTLQEAEVKKIKSEHHAHFHG